FPFVRHLADFPFAFIRHLADFSLLVRHSADSFFFIWHFVFAFAFVCICFLHTFVFACICICFCIVFSSVLAFDDVVCSFIFLGTPILFFFLFININILCIRRCRLRFCFLFGNVIFFWNFGFLFFSFSNYY